MDTRDPAEAVEVLDLLLKFFGDGERWVKGRLRNLCKSQPAMIVV